MVLIPKKEKMLRVITEVASVRAAAGKNRRERKNLRKTLNRRTEQCPNT